MALTATFAADMDQFLRSLENAQVHLQVFDRATKTATRSVTRELESLSGQRAAAEAARIAEAVKRLGGEGGTAAGLLKLTDDELRRVTATMAAATTKAEKLGEDLPDAFKHINAEIAKLPKPLDEAAKNAGVLDATFGKLTASFAAASIVDRILGGIVEFGAGAVRAAGDLVDLSAATGVSIGRLQEWGHVARMGGIELSSLTKASFDLGTALDGGSGSVRRAVERLGLAFTNIRALKPEDQLDAVLQAADALGPSQERNAVLVDLFGNRAAQALARVVDGYRETAAEAAKASDAQVRSLDRAADALDRLQGRLGAGAIAIGGGLAMWAEDSLAALSLVTSGTERFTATQRAMIAEFLNSGGEGLADYLRSLEGARQTDIALSKAASVASADYVRALAEAKAEIEGLTPAQREQLMAARDLDRGFEALATQYGLTADAQRLFGAAVQASARDAKQGSEAVRAYAESLRVLSGAAALADGELAMDQLQDVGGILGVLPSQLEGLRKRFAAAAEAAQLIGDTELAEFYRAVAQELTPIAQFQQRYNVTLGEFVPMGTSAAETAALVADQLAELRGEVKRIPPDLKVGTHAWTAYREAVDEITPAAAKAAAELRALEAAAAVRREHVQAIAGLAAAIADLAQSTGQTEGALGQAGELIGLLSVGATAGANFKASLDRLSKTSEGTGADVLQLAAATVAAAAAMEDATDKAGRMNRALSGVATGASIGSMFGEKGAAVGAAIGGLIGLLRNPAFEDVMRRVGRDWGVQISEELARTIATEADKIFGGNRQAAEIFNLDQIIAEGGGLNAGNLDTMAAKLRDVFVLLQTGAFSAAQAAEVLGENWQAFVDAGTDASGRLAPALVEIIRLTRELGVVSKEVQGYLLGQSTTALEGVNAIINASKDQFDAWEKIADQVKEAQARIDELNKVDARGRGVDWAREMAQAQEDLTKALGDQHAASEGAAAELENLARIAMGAYAAAIEAGLSHNEAMKAAAPGLAQLIKAYEHLGLSVEDAGLKAFLAQAKFVEANPEIIAGIDGLAQSMIALSNMGLLNAETFGHMQEAGLRMYERLLAEAEKMGLGKDEAMRAALLPMQEYLREAARQAELLNIPLDEATQKLIEQSKAAGLWKPEQAKDGFDKVADSIGAMTEKLGALIDELKRIPANVTSNVRVRYTREGDPGPDGGDTGAAASPEATRGPSRASVAAASRAATSGVIRVPVYIDGREVAYAQAPYRRDAERAWGAD